METGYIYKITSPSGKIYVGSTKDLHKRLGQYRRCSCKKQNKIYRSIKKYGWEKHTIEVLEEPKLEEMLSRESYWGNYFEVLGENGLNLSLPKSGDTYSSLSKEYRKIRSDLTKGKNNGMFGKKHSEETKIKIGNAHRGKKMSDESRRKMSESHKGKKLTEEHRRKFSQGKSKLVLNMETGIYYSSITEASKSTIYSSGHLKNMLNPNDSKRNRTNLVTV